MKFFKHVSGSQFILATFLVLIMVGTGLLMLPMAAKGETSLSLLDALFTATSASCVTGLVIVDTGTFFSTFGQLVILGLIQIGGLGVMTFATLFSVALGRKINLAERLRIQESLNKNEIEGVVGLCLRVVKYTFIIEFIFGSILAYSFYNIYGIKGIYFGYWHAVSAFCNAGFDLIGNFRSFTPFINNYSINLCIMILIILGGLGFSVLANLFHFPKRGLKSLSLHTKVVLTSTSVLLLISFLMFFFVEINHLPGYNSLDNVTRVFAGMFQAVTLRTAGFNTLDFGLMTDTTLFFMIVMMFIGASPGSTGGGIKTTTAAVILIKTWNLLRGNDEVVVFDKTVKNDAINKAFIIVVISIIWIVTATLLVSYFENLDFIRVSFEVVSAFATVGLSTGITQNIGSASKVVLILTMFAGRVGILTFTLSLFATNRRKKVRYPEENILIG